MKRVVVGGVRAGDGRMVASDLDPAGRVQMREVRPRDLVVAEHVGCHRLSPRPPKIRLPLPRVPVFSPKNRILRVTIPEFERVIC